MFYDSKGESIQNSMRWLTGLRTSNEEAINSASMRQSYDGVYSAFRQQQNSFAHLGSLGFAPTDTCAALCSLWDSAWFGTPQTSDLTPDTTPRACSPTPPLASVYSGPVLDGGPQSAYLQASGFFKQHRAGSYTQRLDFVPETPPMLKEPFVSRQPSSSSDKQPSLTSSGSPVARYNKLPHALQDKTQHVTHVLSPATQSPENRTSAHVSNTVPQTKSISLPYDQPAVLTTSSSIHSIGKEASQGSSSSRAMDSSSTVGPTGSSNSLTLFTSSPISSSTIQLAYQQDNSMSAYVPQTCLPATDGKQLENQQADSTTAQTETDGSRQASQPSHVQTQAAMDNTSLPLIQGNLLGTWANRQFRLLDPISELKGTEPTTQPGSIAMAASPHVQRQRSDNSMPRPAQTGVQGQSSQQGSNQVYGFAPSETIPLQPQQAAAPAVQGTATQAIPLPGAGRLARTDAGMAGEVGSDCASEAAWRWRFARRWQAEQQRTLQQESQNGTPDKTDEALAYLQAGGGTGWNMQVAVARTHSTDVSGLHSVGTAGTLGQGSLLAADVLLDDGSFANAGSLARTAGHKHRLGMPEDSATRQVNSLNRRAYHLLQQQQQLEDAAEQRWNQQLTTTQGEHWVGNYLPTVEIDDWGTFLFLVVRLRGRDDKQRILIRGRNYCSEAQLAQELNQKMLQVAAQQACPSEILEVMGGGVMEWRRERDRHLHLHSGFTRAAVSHGGLGARPTAPQELLNLAAVLTKQNLPMHFKVTIQDA